MKAGRFHIALFLAGTLVPGLASSAVASQQPPDDGLIKGSLEAARGDSYRAMLTLKDVAARLEKDPLAKRDLAYTYAHLAWAYVGLNRPEDARTAVDNALKTDPDIMIGTGIFPQSVVSFFERARRPLAADPEGVGRAALEGGRPQEALLEFLRALQSRPPPSSTDDARLRRQIVETVRRMDPPPPIPADARKHFENVKALEEAQTLLGAGTTAATATAVQSELQAALRLAPWWPEALFRLAQTQQTLGHLEDAVATLALYKIADPAGLARAALAAESTPTAAEPVLAPEPEAPMGPGTIVVYWSPQFKGGGRPKINCDGARVADLANGRLIRISAEPGLHEVTFHNDKAGVRILPGTLSYLRVAAVGFPPRAEIREVTAPEAESEIAEKGVRQNEANKTYSTTCGVGKNEF